MFLFLNGCIGKYDHDTTRITHGFDDLYNPEICKIHERHETNGPLRFFIAINV